MEARTYDLALELLDYQLVDADGELAGNVDDIEIENGMVSALLSGPGILAERFGGRVGRGWAEMHRRMNPEDESSTSIPIAHVRAVDSAVHLGITRDRLASFRFESWFRRQVVDKIPGAKHAPE